MLGLEMYVKHLILLNRNVAHAFKSCRLDCGRVKNEQFNKFFFKFLIHILTMPLSDIFSKLSASSPIKRLSLIQKFRNYHYKKNTRIFHKSFIYNSSRIEKLEVIRSN